MTLDPDTQTDDPPVYVSRVTGPAMRRLNPGYDFVYFDHSKCLAFAAEQGEWGILEILKIPMERQICQFEPIN